MSEGTIVILRYKQKSPIKKPFLQLSIFYANKIYNFMTVIDRSDKCPQTDCNKSVQVFPNVNAAFF